MKVRHKEEGYLGTSGNFNTHGLGEMIEDGDCTSDYCRDYDVFLEKTDQWVDLKTALRQHDVITDNHNTCFFEPTNAEDRARGYAQ